MSHDKNTAFGTGPLLGAAGAQAARYAGVLQRRHESPLSRGGDEDAAGLRDRLVAEGGSGSAPDSLVRQKVGGHLGFDIGAARLHSGPAAARAAQQRNADAFTIGRDVFFGENKLTTGSRQGIGLLAHELTHVGQQTGQPPAVQRKMSGSLARLADKAQSTSLSPDHAAPGGGDGRRGSPANLLQRDPDPVRPDMAFLMPPTAHPSGDGGTMPAQRATERGTDAFAAAAHHLKSGPRPAPRQADPQAVTDRVYDLMRQELRLGRERGHGGPQR